MLASGSVQHSPICQLHGMEAVLRVKCSERLTHCHLVAVLHIAVDCAQDRPYSDVVGSRALKPFIVKLISFSCGSSMSSSLLQPRFDVL